MPEQLPLFMICNILEEVHECDKFSTWPLHLTIVPWFRLEDELFDKTLLTIEETAKRVGWFAIRPKGNAWYGPDKNVPVTEVTDVTGKLTILQNNLVSEIQRKGGDILDLTYTGRNFSPHVSLTKDGKSIQPEGVINCSNIALVEKTQRKVEDKQVIKVINLV